MKFIWVLSIVFISASDEQLMYEAFQMNRCRSPDQDAGLCVPLQSCPYLVSLDTHRGKESDVIKFKKLAQISCGDRMFQNEILFCCSKPTGSTQKPTLIHEAFPIGGRIYVRRNDQQNPNKSPHSSTKVPVSPTPSRKDMVIAATVLPSQTVPTSSLNKKLETASPRPQLVSSTLPTPVETSQTSYEATSFEPPTFEGQELKVDEERKCIDPEGKTGICISTLLCPPVLSRLLANPNSETYKESLRVSNKICDAHPPVICCPDDEPTAAPSRLPQKTVSTETSGQTSARTKPRLLTPEEGCGTINLHTRKSAAIGSWPWLALLGYKTGNQLSFGCGGSLITSRHVLTAAHCIKNDLKIVRLGEYDLSKSWETKHQDIKIAKVSKHPEYDGTTNDISVLHLSTDIVFTDKIRPACIPDRLKFESKSIEGFHPFVAGWRKKSGEISSVLQEMQLTVYVNDLCIDRYLVPSPDRVKGRIICAGEVSANNDTCSGDSGGPLMLPDALDKNHIFFDIIGVESYARKCGNNPLPGIYTNVIFYSTWIKAKIAEEI